MNDAEKSEWLRERLRDDARFRASRISTLFFNANSVQQAQLSDEIFREILDFHEFADFLSQGLSDNSLLKGPSNS